MVGQEGRERTYKLYSVAREPMERFEEEEGTKKQDKTNVKVVAKYGHSKESVYERVPGPFVQML